MRTPDILYQGQPSTTITDLFTVTTGTATITAIHAANASSDTGWFSVYAVQSGSTYADSNVLAKMQKLVGTDNSLGGGYWSMEFPIPLNSTSDKLQGIQQTAAAVTLTVVGWRVTT